MPISLPRVHRTCKSERKETTGAEETIAFAALLSLYHSMNVLLIGCKPCKHVCSWMERGVLKAVHLRAACGLRETERT